MRAVCCAILALVTVEMIKLKLSGPIVTPGDRKAAGQMCTPLLIFSMCAVLFCILGL